MNHDYETGVALSDSFKKIVWNAPLRSTNDDVISGLQQNLIISETMQRR